MNTKPKPILTAHVGDNAVVFPKILELYVPEGGIILDMTFGKGAFWRKTPEKWVLRAMDICPIKNKCLPWPSASKMTRDARRQWFSGSVFDAAVIDPPYGQGSTATRTDPIADSYNLGSIDSIHDILPLYGVMLKRAHDCLVPKGVCIVKCQDLVDGGKQHWFHVDIKTIAEDLGFGAEDLFVVVQKGKPMMRHNHQLHARKNHSYFWVFRKKGNRHV